MIIKRIRIALFVCYVIFILWMTIFSRHSTGEHRAEMRFMWSYQEMFLGEPTWKTDVWQNIKNILFFIPFGFLFPTVKHLITIVSGLLLSIIIEAIQYIACLGLCELDDVLCNVFGTLVGCLFICFIQDKINKNYKELSK